MFLSIFRSSIILGMMGCVMVAGNKAKAQYAADTLWSIWVDPSLPDTTRMNALGRLAWEHVLAIDPDSARILGRLLSESAETSGHPHQAVHGYLIQGWALFQQGQFEAAFIRFEHGDSLARSCNDKRLGALLNGKASAADQLGNAEMTRAIFEECLRYHEKNGNERSAAQTRLNLGNSYWKQGNLRKAADNFNLNLQYFESQGDSISMILGLNALGTIHHVLQDRSVAERYYSRSLHLAEHSGNIQYIAFARSNLGVLYTELKQWNKALDHFEDALELYLQLGSAQDVGNTYNNMGTVFSEQRDTDKALSLYKQSVAALEPLAPSSALGQALMNIAAIQSMRGEANEALATGERALAIAEQVGDRHVQQRITKNLAHILASSGEYKRAYDMLSKSFVLNDSLRDAENQRHLLQQEFQYAYDKQAQADSLSHLAEVTALDGARRLAVFRSWATGGAGLLLLVGGGLWFRTDRRRREERHVREAAQLETQALRSQMNPHFIFNALNSINAYVQQNDQESASSFLTMFARVMRSVLENSRHSEVPLSEDLEALRGYIDLERMRMKGKFDYMISVSEDIDPQGVLVPPLVVQPFVENAIWHGIARKDGHGHIHMKVTRRSEQLVWTIEDDGIGRQTPKDPVPEAPINTSPSIKKTSLGTTITRARLDLVRKQHGGQAGFRYIEMPKGTMVEVDMPLMYA